MLRKILLAGLSLVLCASYQPGAGSGLRQIADAGRLDDLRWPDFSDYRQHVKNFYEPGGWALAWSRSGKATPQATAMVGILQRAAEKGLNAEDYDGPRWAERISRLSTETDRARFDAALTVCTMRYISDLHIGKVNPKHFKFGLDVEQKKYDLPDFLRHRLVSTANVESALEGVEPPYLGYKRTKTALAKYLELARQDDGEQLPVPAKTVAPGGIYPGVPRLTRLLRLLGDLAPGAAGNEASDSYAGALVDGVKRYQLRHGLDVDGRLGPQTVKSLNTPLSFRIRQMQLTLERWRWLPAGFSAAPIVVNIPEFRLRAFSEEHPDSVALSMRVIVGKVLAKTPVFADTMQYVLLRPYWTVPPGILRTQKIPSIEKDRDYVAKNDFEVVTPRGELVTNGRIDDETLAGIRTGRLMLRQKPGPKNALGLVALMFPNEFNVYLHSTPSQELFAQSRRDFSSGCIRVEKPEELTAWALRHNQGWALERIKKAMESGPDNQQINLAKPIPVLILYGTVVVNEEGLVLIFEDIYGLDADLEKVLAKGYPYPG